MSVLKAIRYLSRIVTGVVFLFSGFVKAVDPLGSAYKFGDYFHAFRLDFLEGISLPLSIFLSAFEIVLGIVILLGYQKRIAYWALFLFMSFFTLLTLVLAITNPVSDCGCFGDALILTNWETFLKNVVLMVFVLILFAARKRAENVHRALFERFFITLFFMACFIFSMYNLRHLPVLDFRPYDIGTSIPEGMEIPGDAPSDEYETALFYRNLETGEEQEFTLENYPRDTTRWEFVTSESRLVKKGYEPPIHDFGIIDLFGNDITDQVLAFEGYTMLMISYDVTHADGDQLLAANDWSNLEKLATDFRFVPVTATTTTILDDIADSLGLQFTFNSADEIMLKTIVRSNPGFVLLKKGIILGKWSGRDLPGISEWGSEWPGLIEQNIAGMDPEIRQMIDDGYLEEITWDLVDFEEAALPILFDRVADTSDRKVWVIYSLTIILVLLFLQLIPKRRDRRRD